MIRKVLRHTRLRHANQHRSLECHRASRPFVAHERPVRVPLRICPRKCMCPSAAAAPISPTTGRCVEGSTNSNDAMYWFRSMSWWISHILHLNPVVSRWDCPPCFPYLWILRIFSANIPMSEWMFCNWWWPGLASARQRPCFRRLGAIPLFWSGPIYKSPICIFVPTIPDCPGGSL